MYSTAKENATRTSESLARLTDVMKAQPEFTTFIQAHTDLQADDDAQRLLKEAQSLQGQLQFGWSQEKQTRFNEVLDEFDAMPTVQAYKHAELALRELFCAVDDIISETVGIEFAENAKRSGCCGG